MSDKFHCLYSGLKKLFCFMLFIWATKIHRRSLIHSLDSFLLVTRPLMSLYLYTIMLELVPFLRPQVWRASARDSRNPDCAIFRVKVFREFLVLSRGHVVFLGIVNEVSGERPRFYSFVFQSVTLANLMRSCTSA